MALSRSISMSWGALDSNTPTTWNSCSRPKKLDHFVVTDNFLKWSSFLLRRPKEQVGAIATWGRSSRSSNIWWWQWGPWGPRSSGRSRRWRPKSSASLERSSSYWGRCTGTRGTLWKKRFSIFSHDVLTYVIKMWKYKTKITRTALLLSKICAIGTNLIVPPSPHQDIPSTVTSVSLYKKITIISSPMILIKNDFLLYDNYYFFYFTHSIAPK